MAYPLDCPVCKKTMRVQSLPPAGARVVCYLCHSEFTNELRAIRLEPVVLAPASSETPSTKPLVWLLVIGGGVAAIALSLVVAVGVALFVMLRQVPIAMKSEETLAVSPPPQEELVAPPSKPAVSPLSTGTANPEASVSQPSVESPKNPVSGNGAAVPNTPVDGSVAKLSITKPAEVDNKPAEVEIPRTPLAYNFQPNMRYSYHFRVRTDGDTSGRDFQSGMVTYAPNVIERDKVAKLISDAGRGQGSGTAFVVTPNGYLVTCHHLIRNAAKIEVTLQEKKYVGKIIATDAKHDLALLKIEATDLPVASLANSEAVQLAEEVRAMGFPLSDVLGTSLKITRGSISGFVEKGEKLLQIDAAINPGNSGGPLVNNRGQVIGICSSGLTGDSVSNVGFAVPSSDALRLLKTHGITIKATSNDSVLDGPELARQLTPAIGFIQSTFGASQENSLYCDYTAFAGGASFSSGMQHQDGKLLASREGEVISTDRDAALPLLIGTYASMVFDKLPGSLESSWETREVSAVAIATESSNQYPANLGRSSLPSRLRGYPGRYGSSLDALRTRPEEAKPLFLPVIIIKRYKLGERINDIQTIHKHYEISTPGSEKDKNYFSLSGDGTIEFDVAKGYPIKCELKLQTEVTRGNMTSRSPFQFSYTLHEALTQEEWNKKLEASRKESEARMEAAAKAKLPENQLAKVRTILQTLEAYRAKPDPKVNIAMVVNELASMEPIPEAREEVAKAVDGCLLEKENSLLKLFAFNVLKKWGTETNVPTLLVLAKGKDRTDRAQAIELLAFCSKDPKFVDIFARLLVKPADRDSAERALKKVGPDAEDAVLALISSEDEEVRTAVCNILGDIGTKKSVVDLERLANSKSNRTVQTYARSALQKVQSRVEKDE